MYGLRNWRSQQIENENGKSMKEGKVLSESGDEIIGSYVCRYASGIERTINCACWCQVGGISPQGKVDIAGINQNIYSYT